MVTKFTKDYKGYSFDVEADGPVSKGTFESFADDAIRYMVQLGLTTHTPIAFFQDYGVIKAFVTKLYEYEEVE